MTIRLTIEQKPQEFEWLGEGRNEICACTHKLSRHANPHYAEVRTIVLTDRCLDCDDCKGFRMPLLNASVLKRVR
jgi:hypothetical protein